MDTEVYTYDQGTGILDKASIKDYTMKSLSALDSVKNLTWLAIMDVDDFKHINDSYGHAYGDKVLRIVAETFHHYLKGVGEVGRFGGDEFFICIRDANEETIRDIFRLARVEVMNKTKPDIEEENGVTISIGTVSCPLNGTDYDALFEKADKALYIAKGKGKNRYIIYREEMHGSVTVPKNVSEIRYVQNYTLRLTECVNKCMDLLLLDGMHQLRYTQALMMDTLALSFIAIYWQDKKRGLQLPEGAKGSVLAFFEKGKGNSSNCEDEELPDFDPNILQEIKSNTDSFATGLLIINNISWNKERCPITTAWMDKCHLREAVFYYPFSKGKSTNVPIYIMGSETPKKWGAEDAHYFMIYANIICCMLKKSS